MQVIDVRGEALGHAVDALIECRAGHISYVVVATGGMAGIDEKLRAVPMAAVDCRADGFVVLETCAEFEQRQILEPGQWPGREPPPPARDGDAVFTQRSAALDIVKTCAGPIRRNAEGDGPVFARQRRASVDGNVKGRHIGDDMARSADDERVGEGASRDPRQRAVEEARIVDNVEDLLGVLAAGRRLQAGSGATAKDHGLYRVVQMAQPASSGTEVERLRAPTSGIASRQNFAAIVCEAS
ncbi:PRC-barrel domain-containing protein [Sphingopyxis sp.]|uniref:PRC-barrel domain-containing protein n=1 Tax=Sphingopyxis sp. TaxID=1908224 RepID=UPI00344F6BB7